MTKQQKNQKVEKTNTQKNYIKNYAILIAIFVVCFGLTIYFCKWYEVYKEYQKEIPVIRGSLLEVHSEDLEHYLVDNPNAIVYMCTSYSDICREYEKKLKRFLIKNDVTDNIVYLNLTNENMEEFLENFNKKYPYRNKLKGNFPSYVVFNNGVVENILQGSQHVPLTISKTQNFLELYLVEEETTNAEGNSLEESKTTSTSE